MGYMKLKEYKTKFETFLREEISSLGMPSDLRDACEYALLNGGKRLRPILVMMIAKDKDVMQAALSVELFHTASLIADDLPCMDNDDLRREVPSLHKAFDEPTALLASYGLITAAFERISRASEDGVVCNLALSCAARCAGISGATGGQYLDLNPERKDEEEMRELIYLKTVTLFEVSFVFGWLFGGGDISRLEKVKKCAYHFGMAFQIADDLLDYDEDNEMNYARLLGKEEALEAFQEELASFECLLESLDLKTPPFDELISLLKLYPVLQ